jgi:hypothetical protein
MIIITPKRIEKIKNNINYYMFPELHRRIGVYREHLVNDAVLSVNMMIGISEMLLAAL